MTITSNYAFQNCACVNKFGTVTTVKNYFWSSINPNIAVKVPFITIYPKKSLMNTLPLSISTTQQSCPVFWMEALRYFWPIFSLPRGSYVHTHQIWPTLYPVMTMSSSTGLFYVIVIWNQASHTYLNLLLFVKLLVLTIAFLHMIQDLWPGNFLQLPPGMTQEELTFPLDLTSNAEFHGQDPNRTYPILLMHEPQSLTALCFSLTAWGTAPSGRKSPFSFGPRQAYPTGHHKKGLFCFIWLYMYFILLLELL